MRYKYLLHCRPEELSRLEAAGQLLSHLALVDLQAGAIIAAALSGICIDSPAAVDDAIRAESEAHRRIIDTVICV